MIDNVLSYSEMCHRENISLQRGMNFGCGRNYSVVLMSRRKNAPYKDQVEENGSTIVYEGHDCPRTLDKPDPKQHDQLEQQGLGRLTQNGKFHKAAQESKADLRHPEIVRVYEKLHEGIWANNGSFLLVDSWREHDGVRRVFKFKLSAIDESNISALPAALELSHRRIIPTSVKLAVWKRDQAKCVLCGASKDLHFDHDLPWSKGGSSITEANVQLLCARHNLSKGNNLL